MNYSMHVLNIVVSLWMDFQVFCFNLRSTNRIQLDGLSSILFVFPSLSRSQNSSSIHLVMTKRISSLIGCLTAIWRWIHLHLSERWAPTVQFCFIFSKSTLHPTFYNIRFCTTQLFAQLFVYKLKLLLYKLSCLFTNLSCLFANLRWLFTNLSCLFTNLSCLFTA